MDQRDRIVETAVMVRAESAADADELAFMARLLVQATMPHSDPGNVPGWGRANGRVSLTITPGQYVTPKGEVRSVGVPYGSIPRLVLAWLTTEAVRTRNPRIILGSSLSDFMHQLGMAPTGGRWGSISRLKEQMKRLFAARVMASYVRDEDYQMRSMEVASEVDLWWEPKRPEQAAIFESAVVLSDRFFRFVTERPVPLDMRVLRALKKSPLGLDLYMWLTYRMSYLKQETVIAWRDIHAQLGAEYAEVKHFTTKAKRELKKIRAVWPGLNVATPRGRLVLRPSPTHVARTTPVGVLVPRSPMIKE